MLKWHDLALDSVQAAMFTPDHAAFAAGRVVTIILRQFAEHFDGEMQVLPIPADVPEVVPRVVLQSADGRRRLHAAPARVDCFYSRGTTTEDFTLVQAVAWCADVLCHYVRESQVRVDRLGLIVQRACASENPAHTLIQRFCTVDSQREPFNRSETFEIHNHKQYAPSRTGIDYRINSWVRCRCGIIERDSAPAVVVTQDLNTIAGEFVVSPFDADGMRLFLSMAADEAESIIRKYFPA